MNPSIIHLFSPEFSSLVLEVLLHSLWQAALVLLILKGVLSKVPVQKSELRYTLSLTALGLVLLGCTLTWGILTLPEKPSTPLNTSGLIPTQDLALSTPPAESSVATTQPVLSRSTLTWTQWATGLWALGAVLMLFRTGHHLTATSRLRHLSRPLNDPVILQLVARITSEMGIQKPIQVRVTEDLSTPGVLGIIRPVLLLPVTLITGLNAEQWKAVIAHELSHIKRHDFAINIVQLIIESLLYFNPFVWMLSRQIRIEREACCDSMAIRSSGTPLAYAEALAALQSFVLAPVQSHFPALQAIHAGGEGGSTLDRVKRLLDRNYRSGVRLKWQGVVGSLTLTLVLITILNLGSKGVVQLAAQILSDRERIDKIEKINDTHATTWPKVYTEEDKITVRGRVQLPNEMSWDEVKQVVGFATSQRPDSFVGYSFRVNEQGEFEKEMYFGDIYLGAVIPGWAPTFLGPLTGEPGSVLEDVELSFDPGFSSEIEITDESGKPIPNIRVEVTFRHEEIYAPSFHLTSDSQGTIAIENCPTNAVALVSLGVDGFEEVTRREIQLQPNEKSRLAMKATKVLSGQVVSKETGNPIPSATFKMILKKRRNTSHLYGFDQNEMSTTSDEQGRYHLSRLASDIQYHFIVEAPGYRPVLMGPLTPNDPAPDVELPPALVFSGEIRNAKQDSFLKIRRGSNGEYVRLYQDIKVGDHTIHRPIEADVVEGDDGTKIFSTRSLFEGPVTIFGEKLLGNFEARPPETHVIIDLDTPHIKQGLPTREVIIHLTPPQDAPPPKGFLAVRSRVHQPRVYYPMPQECVVEDGKVRLEVEVPGEIMIEPYGLIGYWPELDFPSQIKVPEGDTPFDIFIKVTRAGAVYGKVTDETGRNVDASMHLIAIQKPEVKHAFMNLSDLNNHYGNIRGTLYNITPVPLGGTYRLIARSGLSYTVSEPFTLNGENPIYEMNMTLPTGVKVRGRILDTSGQALDQIPIRFSYSTPYSHSFTSQEFFTDDQGRFSFEGINPRAPGTYRVEIWPKGVSQPQMHDLHLDGTENVIRLE